MDHLADFYIGRSWTNEEVYDPDIVDTAYILYYEALKYGDQTPFVLSDKDRERFMEANEQHMIKSSLGIIGGMLSFAVVDKYFIAHRIKHLGMGANFAIKLPIYYIFGGMGHYYMTRNVLHPQLVYKEIIDKRKLMNKNKSELSDSGETDL